MRIGIYPGSFDPFTNGHLDIVQRAAKLVDQLVVGIAINSSKTPLFTIEERESLLLEVLGGVDGVRVASFQGLLVDFARSAGASVIIRGIRAVTDFEYEYAMYQINQELEPSLETVFLLASKEYSFLSSTIIREVARNGRSVCEYVPEPFDRALLQRFGH